MTDVVHRLADLSRARRDLVDHVLRKEGLDPLLLPIRRRAPGLHDIPLAYSQESLWFMCQLADNNGVYNLPSAVRLTGPLERDALLRALGEIVRRHEILRTRFPAVAGRPAQEILASAAVPVTFVSTPSFAHALARAADESARSFDLGEQLPWRVCLYEIGPDDHLLLLVFHHLIWDGWSIGVFVREMAALYQAFSQGSLSPLLELPVQYADYALFQREWLSGERLSSLVSYWRGRVEGAEPIALPTDRPRPLSPSFSGGAESIAISSAVSAAVEELCHRRGATPYMALLTAFQALMSRYTGQARVIVGTPVANRRRGEVEGVIGPIANIAVMATDVSGDPTFAELLSRVQEVTTGSFAHQDIPFEMLVEKLNVPRDPRMNPVFQVMFALHAEKLAGLTLSGLTVTPVEMEGDRSHFDLSLHLFRQPEGFAGCISYSRDLFDPETIRRTIGHYQALLSAAVANPDLRLSALPLLCDEERRWLVAQDTPVTMQSGAPVEELFLARAREAPEAIALLTGDRQLTYGALRERAEELSRRLSGHDAGPLSIVVEDPIEQAITVLGALMARVPFVLKDVPERRRGAPEAPPGLGLDLDAPAYFSFDAGRRTTVSRRALAARIARLGEHVALGPGEALLAAAPRGRDFFPIELLWPLTRGASIAWSKDVDLPFRVAHFTPSGLSSLLLSGDDAAIARLAFLRVTLVSGGLVRPALAEAFHRRPLGKLVYLYSPPEVAADLAFCTYSAREQREALPAGNPDGLRPRVLDGHEELVPIGLPGIIHVRTGPEATTRTQDLGAWSPSGALRLLGHAKGAFWCDGLRVDLTEVEAALLAHPAIFAVHVAVRVHAAGHEELVAYVVPSAPMPRAALDHPLTALLPDARVPISFVPVSALPLTPDGGVDTRALVRLPVLDDALVTAAELRIAADPTVAAVKLLVIPRDAPRSLLHVSDLLPEAGPGGGGEGEGEGEGEGGGGSARARERHTTSASGSLGASPEGSLRGPPAIASGGPLELPEGAPVTLNEALLRTAERFPDRGLTIVTGDGPPAFLSYPELLDRARRTLTGLRARGLGPGDRAILQIDDLGSHYAVFWACVLGGVTPVTVAPSPSYDHKSHTLAKLHNVWELLGRPLVLASARLTGPLAFVTTLYGSPGDALSVASIEDLARHLPAADLHRPDPSDVAFLQLTSGSTGTPKCIQETHRAVLSHVYGVQQHNGYTADDIDLSWIPTDHVVSILTCHLKDTTLGIRQVHVRADLCLASPLLFLRLIEEHRITHSFMPNFAFKLISDALAQSPDVRFDLSSVKRIINAGEQVILPVAEEFLRRTAPFGFPRAAMQPAFGMAEVCTGITYANDWTTETGVFRARKASLLGALEEAAPDDPEAIAFVDLGPVRPGLSVRVVGQDGQIVPERMIGQVQVKGSSVTVGYLHNDEANREAFVGDGWFNTGDLGFLRARRLTITGRQKEMLIVRGANLYCYELEDAIAAEPGVLPTFVAACEVDDPDTGTAALAVIFVPRVPGVDVALIKAIRERVSAEFGVSPAMVIPIDKEIFADARTTSGKIQRSALKASLLGGKLDAILKRVDLALENDHTIPAWFYRPTWKRREIEITRRPSGTALVVLDAAGLGEALCQRLGEEAVAISAGAFLALERLGPRRFALDLRDPEQTSALLLALQADGITIGWAIHLAAYGDPGPSPSSAEAWDRAYREAAGSLLGLAQSLAGAAIPILVAASHGHAGAAGQRVAAERASLRALAKVIPEEWPGLACRHVDLPFGEADATPANVARVLAEAGCAAKDRDVRYQDGARLVQRLAPVLPVSRGELPWKRGDLVLVAGGLGGIGIELARYLLAQHDLRLLLIGRSPLEGTEDVAAAADALAAQQSRAERRKAFGELAASGRALYEAVDVSSLEELRAAVARAERHFGATLAGAIHLAGVFPTRLLAEESAESFAETARPKLAGGWALSELVGDDGFLVAVSSAYSFFGGVAVGAYAAASLALDALLEDDRRRGRSRRSSLSFTHWDDLGMSRGYALVERSVAQGYSVIGRRRGLASLTAGLGAQRSELFIGLDGQKPNVRRHLALPPEGGERLVAYVERRDVAAPGAEIVAEVSDRFGAPAPCEIVAVPRMPRDASGAIDEGALAGMRSPSEARAERLLPRTGLERTIAAIWREALHVDAIDVNTSFFSLGGQSVLLVQVLSKLKAALDRDLSVVDLFRYPTVSSLASFLGQSSAPPARSFQHAAERAQKQRQVARQRIVTRGRPGPREKTRS